MSASDFRPEPGWLDRRIEATEEESKSWPTWMRRAAGVRDQPPVPASTTAGPAAPAEATPADRLGAALRVLDLPLKALHADAAAEAVRALAALRDQDAAATAEAILCLARALQELGDELAELRDIVGPAGDGR